MTTRAAQAGARVDVAGLARILAGAELHYWRVDPAVWPKLLDGARSLGLPTLASYVQWQFHEVAPGAFDFEGRTSPRRNLRAYLDLVAGSGLNLVIRPGPYTFAEWRNYGIPDDVAGEHRLSPAFLASAGRWIDAVSEELRPYLATGGGPIVLLQADNMFDLGQNRYDRGLGLLGGDGIFKDFLREAYPSIADVNAAWGTSARSFDELVATTLETGDHALSHPRYLDFTRFRSWYAEKAARWTVERFRAGGMDVPICTNPIDDQDMSRTAATVDLIGLNHYPTRDYDRPRDHQVLLEEVRLGTALSPLSYVIELESGIWHGYHYTMGIPYPDHYQAMFSTMVAGGARNWSWYMLHDRDNWYMAPFNESGEPRTEVVEVFRRCVAAWREGRAWEWAPRVRTGVTWSSELTAADDCQLFAHDGSGLRRAIYDAGIDYAFTIPGEGPTDRLLFLDDRAWLPAAEARRLLAWVEAGGHLVAFADTATRDESLRRDDTLGLLTPDGSFSQGYMDTFWKDVAIELPGGGATIELPKVAGIYLDPPGEPIEAVVRKPEREISDNVLGEYERLVALGVGERFTVGYRRTVGAGRITVLAVHPTPALIAALHRAEGVEIPALPRTASTIATLYDRGEDRILVVLNLGHEPQTVVVDLAEGDAPAGPDVAVRDLLSRPERADAWYERERRRVSVSLGKRSGTIIELSTS